MLPVKVLAAFPTTSVPAVTAKPPVVVPMTPDAVMVPAPDLLRVKVGPETAATVREVSAAVAKVGVPVRVALPKVLPPTPAPVIFVPRGILRV